MMYEDILAAVARGDKTKTFCVVKPLYCSCRHEKYLCWLNCDVLQRVPESELWE